MSALQPIIDWAGEVFYEPCVDTVTYKGYHSIWTRGNSQSEYDRYELIQEPFDVTVTTNSMRIKPSAILASVLLVLVFVTVVTWLKNIFRR